MIKLTFRQLEVFRVVAKYSSLTKASKAMYLSQPAVSSQVKQLENKVGLKLFEIKSKQLNLTQAGQILLESSVKINNNLAELSQKIQDLKGIKTGHLELSVVSTANAFSTKLLAKFIKLHPNVTFSLHVSNRKDLLNLFKNNEITMAIMGLPPESLKVKTKVIKKNPLVIVSGPGHKLAHKKNIAIQDIAKEIFVVRELGSGTRHTLNAFFAKHNLEIDSRLEFSSAEAIKDAVQAGLGLALVSEHTIKNSELVVLDIIDTPIVRHWHLVTPINYELPPVSRKFYDFILQESL